MKIFATVNNLPANIGKYLAKNNGILWITARAVEGELWYYGLWYTKAEADAEAREVEGITLKVEG